MEWSEQIDEQIDEGDKHVFRIEILHFVSQCETLIFKNSLGDDESVFDSDRLIKW